MPYSDDRLNNKKTSAKNQSKTEHQKRDEEVHDLDNIIKFRGGNQDTQDGKGKNENGNSHPESLSLSVFCATGAPSSETEGIFSTRCARPMRSGKGASAP